MAYSAEMKHEILRLARKGRTVKQISDAIPGAGAHGIRNICKKNNVKLTPARVVISEKTKDQVVDFYVKHGGPATSKKFGFRRSMISSWAKQRGKRVENPGGGVGSALTDKDWEPYIHVLYAYDSYKEMAEHTPWTETTVRRKAISLGIDTWKSLNPHCVNPLRAMELLTGWPRSSELHQFIETRRIQKWEQLCS